jgi:hypothetical protein
MTEKIGRGQKRDGIRKNGGKENYSNSNMAFE